MKARLSSVCFHFILHPSSFVSAERSHSGLVHRSRKPEWSKGHRGFESHPLRHLFCSRRNSDLSFSMRMGGMSRKGRLPKNFFNLLARCLSSRQLRLFSFAQGSKVPSTKSMKRVTALA